MEGIDTFRAWVPDDTHLGVLRRPRPGGVTTLSSSRSGGRGALGYATVAVSPGPLPLVALVPLCPAAVLLVVLGAQTPSSGRPVTRPNRNR